MTSLFGLVQTRCSNDNSEWIEGELIVFKQVVLRENKRYCQNFIWRLVHVNFLGNPNPWSAGMMAPR